MNRYYIDTCIWLNLIKREAKGKKLFWKFAQEFLEQHSELITSSKIIHELESKGIDSKELLEKHNVKIIEIISEDLAQARIIESNSHYLIGFYDCIHLAICFRLNATLITRDYLLIQEAKKYKVFATEPERLLY